MAISEQARTRLGHFAASSLSTFRTVGDAACAQRDAPSSTSADTLATISTFNSAGVIQALAEADAANRRLTSLPLGADFTLRIAGETVKVEVVERAELHPDFDARGGKS